MTSTIAPDDAAAASAAALSEIDFYLLAQPIAEALGDGWSDGTDDKPTGFADRTIRLVHCDGRTIGLRHLWQGRAVQTFAVGGPAPTQPADRDQDSEDRLAKGVRYSTGVRITTASPLHEILTAIRTVLLPAFNGQRPRLRANGTPIPPAVEAPARKKTAAKPASTADPAAPDSKASKTPKTKSKAKTAGRRTAPAKRTTKRRTTPATA